MPKLGRGVSPRLLKTKPRKFSKAVLLSRPSGGLALKN